QHGGGPWSVTDLTALQRNRRYGLWTLRLTAPDGQRRRAVLKVLGPSRRMRIERNLYMKGYPVLEPVLPRVYACREHRGRTWVFQQHVHQLAGRHPWTPDTFARVIPLVARLHAATYRPGGSPAPEAFAGWVPSYAGGYYAGRGAYRRARAFLRRALLPAPLAARPRRLSPHARLPAPGPAAAAARGAAAPLSPAAPAPAATGPGILPGTGRHRVGGHPRRPARPQHLLQRPDRRPLGPAPDRLGVDALRAGVVRPDRARGNADGLPARLAGTAGRDPPPGDRGLPGRHGAPGHRRSE